MSKFLFKYTIVIVQTIEMPSPYFCFISFPHLLGKTEEECSFHTLKALFPSRKWATEDTTITLPSSNADVMGYPLDSGMHHVLYIPSVWFRPLVL